MMFFQLPIFGLPYHDAPALHEAGWKGLPKKALRLRLEREPENPKDPHAISVWVQDSTHPIKIGYLPVSLALLRQAPIAGVCWLDTTLQPIPKKGAVWVASLIVAPEWHDHLSLSLTPQTPTPTIRAAATGWLDYGLPYPDLFIPTTQRPILSSAMPHQRLSGDTS